jgi:signal transduction histidine kinase
LLDRLEKAFKAQRNFIANASHELRTPLTVISGQLEVLLLMERSSEDYRRAVASVLEDMRSLNKLSNRLLLLAQADNASAMAGFAPVRIDEILWQARSELLRNHKENIVDVSMVEVEDERYMQVAGVENLLRSLIFNLMENGCKYSPEHRVEVGLQVSNGNIDLEFRDQGIGIPEEEKERIFSPFFRGSNTAGHHGHGIGLSLVRRILDLHGGSVTFAPNNGAGTVFRVSLPHL